jgi:membrane associated rhomboid family serine protease
MLIPFGTDRPLRRPTLVNHVLVGVNVAVFLAGVIVQRVDPVLFAQLKVQLTLHPDQFRWWGLITYAFLHDGFMHLAGNMLFLWVFGPNVEDRFGRLGYLAFYLLGGALAGGIHSLFYGNPILGASGAVAAVTGAYFVLFPHTRIKTIILFFIIGVYEIPAWWIIGGQFLWNLFAQGTGASGNVATFAHLVGYVWGISVSMLLLAAGVLPREPYDLFTMSRQAARRRQFREAHFQHARAMAQSQRAGTPVAEPAVVDALAQDRAEVTVHIPGDLPAAAAAYKKLLEKHGATVGASLLSRRSQYDLANYLFESGDHMTAATAYQLFLEGYPTDSETPMVRLMLGLISARYLNDPVKAKAEIGLAMPGLAEGPRGLAMELLAELG